jgi:hypothetical protein
MAEKVMANPGILENELSIFKKAQNELRASYPTGGFVVIKDQEILGVWSDRNDALKIGIEKWGNTPFLVKNINDDLTHAINFSRNIKFMHGVPNE